MEEMRRCRQCCVAKPLSDFHISLRARGDDPYSKTCERCFQKEREYAKKYYQDVGRYRYVHKRPPKPLPTDLRVCKSCGVEKVLIEFVVYSNRKRNEPEYYGHRCIECEKRINRERAMRGRKKDPAHFRAIQQRHREHHAERYRQRRKNIHPDIKREYKQRRRARVAGGGGSFTAAEWQALCNHYGNVCLCCGQVKLLTADHIIPVSKGGSSDITNIQPLCGPCNSGKSDRIIDYRPDKGRRLMKQLSLF